MASKQNPERNWTAFAWRGIQLDVPDDWNLGAVTGTDRKGHLRLDDDEIARVEVNWERGRARLDVKAAAASHLEQLERVARKKKIAFRSKRNVRIAVPADMETTCFEWRGDFHALNLLAFCSSCKRVTLVRVLGRPGEKLKPVAARVFESLRDHAVNGVIPWAVYGFRCAVPEQFHLEDSVLNLQRVELKFRSGGEEAAAARSNLAAMQLRERTLEQWLREAFRKELKNFDLKVASRTYRGHEALDFSGKTRLARIRSVVARSSKLVGRLWRCGDSDKLFVVRWRGREDRSTAFEPFCDSVSCHEVREP